MTLSDLSNYQVSIRKTLSITYRNYRIFSTGTPSSGSVALSMLKIIEGYNMSDPSHLNLNTHRLNEAMRYSYAARGELGDPDFFKYMEGFETEMLREETVKRIRAEMEDANGTAREPGEYDLRGRGWVGPENHGTSHVVASDREGMSITLTSTVNLLFGSHLMVPETGAYSLYNSSLPPLVS